MTRAINRAYLLYLGLLPALGTFAVLYRDGNDFPFLVFLGGTVAVGVYLAVVYSYTRLPDNPWLTLALLLDGPLLVLISQRQSFNPLGFAIEGYLVDGTAIWLAILLLAMTSPLPTRGQRFGSVFFMVVALVVTGLLFWPYIQEALWGHWLRLAWLIAGALLASWINFWRFDTEAVQRDESNFSTLFIAGLVMLWVVAMFAGVVLSELKP